MRTESVEQVEQIGKTMLTSRRCLALWGALAIIAATASLTADTLVLRDGSKVEGKLRSCDDTDCFVDAKKISIETIARIELQPAASGNTSSRGPSVVMADGTVRPGHFEGLSLGSVVIDGKEIDREDIAVIVLADIAAPKPARDNTELPPPARPPQSQSTPRGQTVQPPRAGDVSAQPGMASLSQYNRGVEAANARRWADAATALTEAVRLDPDDSDTHFQLGTAYKELGRFDEAAGEFTRATVLNPRDGEAFFYLGWSENQSRQFEEALKPLEQAVVLMPKDAKTHAELGYAYLKLGKRSEAMREYSEVVRLQPESARAHYLKGWAANAMGDFADAIDPLKRAISLPPDVADEHSELGFAYRNLKRYDDALGEYKRAIALDPKYAPAHHGLGVVYLQLGQKDAAQDELRILKSLDSTWADKLAQSIAK